MTRITLLTDFGTRDGYVAAMRGVIAGIAPAALVDDATHDIPPGNVRYGAYAFGRFWRLYPPGTIHVLVVDPGVGTDRRGLAGVLDGRLVVAPDNGLLTVALARAESVRLVRITAPEFLRDSVSGTFHGRDIFAPVAAHLANGVAIDSFGEDVSDPVTLEEPIARIESGIVSGTVLLSDRFGNLMTNIPATLLFRDAVVSVGEARVGPVRSTYGDVAPGECLALTGSAGMLEIAVRDGSAEDHLGCGAGTPVTVRRSGS